MREIKIKICSDGTHDSLFICGVYGDVTLDALNDINDQILEDAPDKDWDGGIYTAKCSYNEEERGDYGRILNDAYWDIDYMSFEPFE